MAALWPGERSERGEMEREERRLSARSHGLNQCVVKEESSTHSNGRNVGEVWGEEVAAGKEEGSGVGPFRQWSERGGWGPQVSHSAGQGAGAKRFFCG